MTTRPLDPRRHAYREDLASETLKDRIEAPRYAAGERRIVRAAHVSLRKRPDGSAGFETEILFGEAVTVFDVADGWAWVQAERDGYVGYLAADALDITGGGGVAPTHVVRAVGTFVYPEPNIKTPPALHMSLNSRLTVLETRETFAALATGGFVIAHHIAPCDQPALDFVAIAERLEGTPYLWGGRTRLGLDCSGLVQLAMHAAGFECPRDTDMQRDDVGVDIPVPPPLAAPKSEHADVDGLQRGDLVFWQGHVGIMTDSHMLLHANGHHMATIVEPVIDAAVRIQRKEAKPVIAIRRPSGLSMGARAS
jgi:cell wall-associated NlpC family hydrolase